ncbi:hypothetical protein JQ557_26390 [Bradyrhizobium sp. U87765 SZCCT0131]|uniref:hypothetical protein n=1 Tax=unclassified Bradyrhizobium TaxID=2631580 RepID=UPI001BAD9FFE|nr:MULTISPECIES: hypothetical protein [unclassified Bradyrhizobium]MBR1221556.1 hypothetical protein [Bradyrhizobium sp. U87765 SZCCT0131]MBR1264521.1 hypothetical protein [Bradyrhizobium sp. U87765 SZCCT0134]MBR1304572.1 hypothetical protein [Bradyrhizobium sp. U87765 SZCCT0110]MBR1322571.1 hypothetical protein [Bradyrhizobium sp. U87765 SZCCT0109]MBR1346501.1 hypothetical protein [Bradyrhizobium sp. U87765 SZCCT0048]
MSPSPHTPLIVVGLLAIATAASPLISARSSAPQRVTGVIERLRGNTVTIRAPDGASIMVRVAPGTEIAKLLPATPERTADPDPATLHLLPHLARGHVSDLSPGVRISALVQREYARIEQAQRIDVVSDGLR